MSSDLAGVLQTRVEEMISGATTRLVGRPEFLYERAVVAGQVRRCVLALKRAEASGTAAPLAAAALALGRADTKADRGYRRAQMVLEAICAEAADQVRGELPRASWREALDQLGALLGPAQLGLATMFRPDPRRVPAPH